MSIEQLRNYNNKKIKEWRLKNPEKNKELRKKYKHSEKGKIANLRYFKNYLIKLSPQELLTFEEARRKYFRERYRKNPRSYKQSKDYIRNYMKEYMKSQENHRKYLIRQKDKWNLKIGIILPVEYCQLCGSKENLEIHHKTYDETKNIIILCRACHRRLHRKTKLQNGGK